ncbi:MAG: hypothetical protein IPM29_02645 [Planctomycetes bacterium]|nr:hypothetical protein [Planctomycetota bacterium]
MTGSETGADSRSRRAVVLDAALRAAGLDAVWRGELERLLARGDDDWRTCCLGGCDPCVLQLARAVDFVRRESATER